MTAMPRTVSGWFDCPGCGMTVGFTADLFTQQRGASMVIRLTNAETPHEDHAESCPARAMAVS